MKTNIKTILEFPLALLVENVAKIMNISSNGNITLYHRVCFPCKQGERRLTIPHWILFSTGLTKQAVINKNKIQRIKFGDMITANFKLRVTGYNNCRLIFFYFNCCKIAVKTKSFRTLKS